MKPDCPYLHTVPKPKAMASRGKEAYTLQYHHVSGNLEKICANSDLIFT